jgi:hypothetical protein
MKFDQDKNTWPCYKYFLYWMKHETLKEKYPRVWNAFVEHCDSETLAKQACTWGENPLVHIGGVECGVNGEYRGRSGNAGDRDTVYINTEVAKKYQNGGGWLIFESTVLHEMVHWARFIGGKSRLFNGQEAGKAFEIKAYGRDINCGCYTCER